MDVDLSGEEVDAYRTGRYEEALGFFRRHVEEHPAAMEALFTLVWTCERVVAVTPDDLDLERRRIEEQWSQASSLRRSWLRARGRKPGRFMRCKWCGHYTEWRHPNGNDFENYCHRCGAKYPAPDIEWDDCGGMAYSEGRGSWTADSLNSRIYNEMWLSGPQCR